MWHEQYLIKRAQGFFRMLLRRGMPRANVQQLAQNIRRLRRGTVLSHATDVTSPITQGRLLSPVYSAQTGLPRGSGGAPLRQSLGAGTPEQFIAQARQIQQQVPSGMSKMRERLTTGKATERAGFSPGAGQVFFVPGGATPPVGQSRPYRTYARLGDVRRSMGGMTVDPQYGLAFGSTGLASLHRPGQMSLSRTISSVPDIEYLKLIRANPQLASRVVPQSQATRLLGRNLTASQSRLDRLLEEGFGGRIGNVLA